MLSSNVNRRLFQAFPQHRQRVEATNESRVICPDIVMEDHVEAVPLLAVDEEKGTGRASAGSA